MPRGRHRHSPPLHKLLLPTSVAGVAALSGGSVWALADPMALRGVGVVAALAAATGAVLMRRWDRDAGHRVAELLRARENDQWKTDERVADLEADADEAREIRAKLDSKLRAKRVELARLRGEHAALLRRYANAETQRATALEGRRRLAIEASVEPKALAAGGTPTPSAYLMANRALGALVANAARQQGNRPATAVRSAPTAPVAEAHEVAMAEDSEEAVEPEETVEPARERVVERARPALPARRASAPSAIVPYARRQGARRERRSGAGFDFFGTQGGHGGAHGPEAGDQESQARGHEADAEVTTTAPVVGAEVAEAVADTTATTPASAEEQHATEAVDLAEHEGTEQLPFDRLRSVIGS